MVDKKKFAEESSWYRIHFVGRNVQITDAMKNYLVEKLSKVERIHSDILDLHVIMESHRIEKTVSLMIHFSHFIIKVHATSSDMYASIDEAVDRLTQKIRKWKKKIVDHHRLEAQEFEMSVNVIRSPSDVEMINEEIVLESKQEEKERFDAPHIMGSETIKLKTLTQEEALFKIDMSGDHFLLFRCEEDRKLKLLYRRPDGNHGLVQAE